MKFTILTMAFVLCTPVTAFAFGDQDNETHAHEQAHGHDHRLPQNKPDKHEETHEHGGAHENEHEGAEEATHDEHDEEATVHLSEQQLALANITFATLKYYDLAASAYAPGEIKANGYKSYLVSPRINSVVTERYAVLGEHIKAKQPLVGLFSEEMVSAQSELQQAATEWFRLREIGQRSVGEQRFVSARTRYKSAYRKLKVFGLDEKTIKEVANNENYPLGEYTLSALDDGVVMQDDFNRGQRIEAGQALLLISDETKLWVEARLCAHNDFLLSVGDKAEVIVGDMMASASIIQEAHTIDPVTRTRIVRMNLDNQDHQFHSGMFADIYFHSSRVQQALAVPESALMRSAQGQWQIFIVNDDGELAPKNVMLGEKFGDFQQISGVEPGLTYVATGAFFVASEIAKGGFDPHNH